ncbi:MAG: IS1595 family transposase [Actinomycetota bacterium]
MPRVDRNNPKRGSASESRYSLMEFERDFPDDATCLEWLVGFLYPDGIFCKTCDRVTKHHRDARRPSYSCQFCGRHEHPMKGTIFENSATSLKLWFYAMYLMASTRCGISAKQLERELGVTYKTAWRMFHKLRTLLAQDGGMFEGTVEADETFMGRVSKWKHVGQGSGRNWAKDKTVVFGMAQRGIEGQSGKVKARIVPSTRKQTLLWRTQRNVRKGSTIFTDENPSYTGLHGLGYDHGWINHRQRVYVHGDVHTNTIEGFFSLIKRGISGVYHGVGDDYLQTYLDEYVFRYNHRDNPRGMMAAMLGRIAKTSSSEA